MAESKEDFCGYVCGPELDKIKSYCDNLRTILKVNPELAKVMIGKARNEIYLLEEDIWRAERKQKTEERIAPNEVVCSYCRGGPIGVSDGIWQCHQCGRNGEL